jgi:hypothetical protein
MFSFPYDESLHGARLQKDLDLSHLDVALQQTIYALIIKYWSVFDERGVFVPVRNYECVIDTGNAHPISVKKIMYGPNELPIMQKAVAALETVGHIRQITNGCWLFKAVLAKTSSRACLPYPGFCMVVLRQLCSTELSHMRHCISNSLLRCRHV